MIRMTRDAAGRVNGWTETPTWGEVARVMLAVVVIIAALTAGVGTVVWLNRPGDQAAPAPQAPVCWLSATEDSQPVPVACDYRLGAWWPRTGAQTVTLPPCDDDAPGRPIKGPCWLWDDSVIALWPYPYAPAPWYVLDQSVTP